jgi:hypothetical protein
MKKLLAAVSVLTAFGLAAPAANACGYYAVFQCAKSANLSGPGYTIATNNFDTFRPGYYCRVLGPFNSQSKAKAAGRAAKSYVKFGCENEGD